MNIDNQELETFLIEAELINQRVKSLAENKISPEEIDRLEAQRAQDKRRREEAKLRKQQEALQKKVKGNDGKGITKDFANFCRFCHKQFELETPKCLKCNRPTMTLQERQKQLQHMVEDYKFNKTRRDEKKHKWQMFQKTQAALWKKSSINYGQKWQYFVEDSQQQTQKEPILPKNDPNFMALEADIQQRKKRRAKDTENAKRLKQKGNAAMKEGDYQKAMEFYTLALEHIKDIKSIYTNRALAYIKLKKYKKAIKDCTNVIEFMQIFEKVGESKDLMFKALSRRALAKKELKQYKEALDDVNQSLKLFSSDSNALLLKKEIEGFIQHASTVERLIRQNRQKQLTETKQSKEEKVESESESDEEQKSKKLEKQIVKELAERQLAQQTKKVVEKQKTKQQTIKQSSKQDNPIKQIPKRLQDLNEQNVEYLLHLLLKQKDLRSIFISSKGIERTLDYLTKTESPKNEALLVCICLEGDGVGEKRVWDWGISKIYDIILSKFEDETKLNQSVYSFVNNLLQILVPMTLSDLYRPQLSSDKIAYQFVQKMFPKLITKYKKQPHLLDNFITLLSNLCSGDSVLKNSYLKKQKFNVILESIYFMIFDHKSKNREILELKQSLYSFMANVITNVDHRKTFIQFLVKNDKLKDLKEQLELYPRSVHNFDVYIENVLSVTANACLDSQLEANELSEAIFDRFIKNWEQYNTTIIHRSFLTVGRIKYISSKNLVDWMKIFDRMAVKIDPLSNSEDKYMGQVVKILNVLFGLGDSESITEIPQNLLNLLVRLVQNNQTNEQLFCNTCNLFGIFVEKKNELSEKILLILRTLIGKLVEIAKEKIGNWRKFAAILLGKSSSDPLCKQELAKHHGMDVLKSIASFVIDKK